MALHHWYSYLINSEGQPINAADITVYLAGTTTPVNVYLDSSGSSITNTSPQLTSNVDGFFQFWVSDDTTSNPSYGYNFTQKFKIAWNKSGVTTGILDDIAVFPALDAVDITSTNTISNKLVSNNLLRKLYNSSGYEFSISYLDWVEDATNNSFGDDSKMYYYTLTHIMNTQKLKATVYNSSTNKEIMCDIVLVDNTSCRVYCSDNSISVTVYLKTS
jgi:hypothetical protein